MKTKTPAHFKSVSLENFRGFKKAVPIPLAPLTFLVGPNSSGKSSIYDALLLLTQSEVMLTDEPPLVPTWIGSLVDLGSFKDAVYDHKTSLTIKLGVELSLASGSGSGERPFGTRQPIGLYFEIRSSKVDPVGNVRLISVVDSISRERMTMRFQPGASPKLEQKYLGRVYESGLGGQLYGMGYPFADVAAKIERTLDTRRGVSKG